MRYVVVDITAVRGDSAPGIHAGAVSGFDVFSKMRGWSITRGAVVKQCSADRVSNQTPPRAFGGEFTRNISRDRAVPRQLAGELIQAQQRGQGNGDPDLHLATTAPAANAA